MKVGFKKQSRKDRLDQIAMDMVKLQTGQCIVAWTYFAKALLQLSEPDRRGPRYNDLENALIKACVQAKGNHEPPAEGDCGKEHFHVRELDRTKILLSDLLAGFMPADYKRIKTELARLEALPNGNK